MTTRPVANIRGPNITCKISKQYNKEAYSGVKISTGPAAHGYLDLLRAGWFLNEPAQEKSWFFGTFWGLVTNFIEFPMCKISTIVSIIKEKCIYNILTQLWWLDRKLHIFPIDLSMGWLKFVRASKFWKLLAQLAGRDLAKVSPLSKFWYVLPPSM